MSETSPLVSPETVDLAKEKATEAGKKVLAYAGSVANGNASIRVMALACGIALLIDSVVSVIGHFFTLHFINALLDFYAFCFGAAAVVMESDREAVPYASTLRGIIGKNIAVVRTVTGRGLFYGVAASLEIAQGLQDSSKSAINRSTIIGYVMLFVGVAYVFLGRQAEKKLTKLRNQAWPERKVKNMFKKYDIDGSDRIEFEEFYKLLKDLNVDLAMQEAELMYLSLDKDMNHGLKYEEFQKFWTNSSELNSFRV